MSSQACSTAICKPSHQTNVSAYINIQCFLVRSLLEAFQHSGQERDGTNFSRGSKILNPLQNPISTCSCSFLEPSCCWKGPRAMCCKNLDQKMGRSSSGFPMKLAIDLSIYIYIYIYTYIYIYEEIVWFLALLEFLCFWKLMSHNLWHCISICLRNAQKMVPAMLHLISGLCGTKHPHQRSATPSMRHHSLYV